MRAERSIRICLEIFLVLSLYASDHLHCTTTEAWIPSRPTEKRPTVSSSYTTSYTTNTLQQRRTGSTAVSVFKSSSSRSSTTTATLDEQLNKVLDLARRIGPVGSFRSEEEQDELMQLAMTLKDAKKFKSTKTVTRIPQPAKTLLSKQVLPGSIHDMVYSAAPGASSGRLFGRVAGKVQQVFLNNNDTFENSVEIGPLKIILQAKHRALDGDRTRVDFKTTTLTLFGQEVSQKDIGGGGGVWDYIFAGIVENEKDGSKKLVRIMTTPSLFVLESKLE